MEPSNNNPVDWDSAGPQTPSEDTHQALGINIVGGASTSGTMDDSVTLHDRQVEALPPANKVQSVYTRPDHDTGNLRTALISQAISYLSIVRKDISGLPVVTGVFVRAFRQPMVSEIQASVAQVPVLRDEDFLSSWQMDIVVSPGQCKDLARVMGRFLHKEKKEDARVSSFSGTGVLQEEKFHYLFNGEEFFSIRLLTLDAPVNLNIGDYTYQPSEGKPVTLRISTEAWGTWLNQQFAGLVNNPCAYNIIETEFQTQAITDEEAWCLCPEIQQWIYSQQPVYLHPAVYYTYCAANMPQPVYSPLATAWQSGYCSGTPQQFEINVPVDLEASAITSVMQPGKQGIVEDQTGDLTPSSTAETATPVALQSGPAHLVLNNGSSLIKDTDAIQDLGFSLIADVLPSLEPAGAGIVHQGSKVEQSESNNESSGDSKSRGRRQRRGVNAPERTKNARKKGSARGLRARGSDRYGFAAAIQALTKVTNVVADEQRARLEKLSIPDEVISGLNNLISTEKSAELVRHPFRRSPFLGRAQCYYVKQPEEGFNYSYEGLAGIIEKMVHELCDSLKQSECSVASQNEVRAIIAALMLKYLVYMPKEKHQMSALLFKLTDMIEHDCRIIAHYEAGSGSPILKLLPQTFLVVLTSAELEKITLPVNLQQRLVSTLVTIMSASNHHGCYDISASIISSLHQLPLDLPLPDLNWQEVNNLAIQIQETFGYLHKLMDFPGALRVNRLTVARAVMDLRDGLHALQEKGKDSRSLSWFSPAPGKQDRIAMAVRSAEKILGDDELAFKKACRELVLAKRKAQEDIRRKRLEARMRMQQKESHPPEQPGRDIEQPEEQNEEQSEKSRYCLVTAPIRETAVDAIKLELSPWEQKLAVAVSLYKDGQLAEAEASRASALKACKDKIDRACVWADCGNALLEPYHELLARVVTVTAKVTPVKRLLDLIAQLIPDDVVKKSGDAKNWLSAKKYKIPKEASLLSLAMSLPSQDEMNSLLKALRSTVEMYEKAVELMNDCSVLQLRDTGDFILHIMESDLNSLFDQQDDLLSIRKVVASVMTARSELMKKLGFYGPRSGSSASTEAAITYQKSVYTQLRERLSREAAQFDVNEADLTKWGNLMERIGQLRIKSSEV
ncbi:hypothetical protein J7438_10220 [Thalassotalea sp. G20_0]|uniref:hypothetical protein n=1 Tax=Thalassotalea sp. G20_0 TaxID=2821093 RepID=UPI001ADC2C44|nr:hypothetical protein [Thalassotalea sp. G20_0]MBO9494459.1 hypothetical protein [Thalassotalea sp. G20_0]